MSYTESYLKISRLRTDEFLFRAAITHMMDVGIRHLTKECVDETCKEIMLQDDSKSVLKNEYQCEIVKLAYELAQIDLMDLLVYIQRAVVIDLCDGEICYPRMKTLLRSCIDWISDDDCNKNAEVDLYSVGFQKNEIQNLGYTYLLENDEDDEDDK